MTDITKQKIDQVLCEIESLKTIINQSKTRLYQVSLPKHFRISFFLLGIVILAFSLTFYSLLNIFGGYNAIPGYIRGIFGVAVAVSGIILLPVMAKLWGDSLKKKNRELSLEKAIETLVSYRIFIFWLPVELSGIAFAIYFYLQGQPYYVIPTFAIVLGLQFSLIGSMAESIQWTVNGYWFFATALFVALNPIPAALAVGLTFGCGFLLFAVSSLVAEKYYG